MNRTPKRFVVECDGATTETMCKGRVAWALERLIEAGPQGVTPIGCPGPRWAAYVHKLRRLGIHIATVPERHEGPFPGRHARYVLLTKVKAVGHG